VRHPHPRRRDLPLAAALVLALSACGGGDAPEPAPEPEASSSAPSTPGTRTGTGTAAEVEPASGLLIEEKPYRVRMPDGWRRSPRMSTFLEGAYDGLERITVSHLPSVGSPTPGALARARIEGSDPRLRRVEDAEVGGLPAIHLVGEDASEHSDQFALVHLGEAVDIEFSLTPGAGHEDHREEIIASVLASWEWR
jgi:hypothetical protein